MLEKYTTREADKTMDQYCLLFKCKRSNVRWLQWSIFFLIFEIKFYCFVIAIFALVHDVEAIFHLLCGNLF